MGEGPPGRAHERRSLRAGRTDAELAAIDGEFLAEATKALTHAQAELVDALSAWESFARSVRDAR